MRRAGDRDPADNPPYDVLDDPDLVAIAAAWGSAKAGDVAASRELLDRIIGQPLPAQPTQDDDGEGKQVVIWLELDDAG